MEVRFKKKSDAVNIVITALAAVISVVMMIYGVITLGFPTKQFNYWCTLNIGVTVLLRDILFAPPLANFPLHLACLTLSVTLLVMLTYFYARKDWKTYSKANLWMIFIVDVLIALLYNLDILIEPADEYTTYMMVEIWIRPTITYGLVACYVKEASQE